MQFSDEDLWESGESIPSLKAEIVSFLDKNSDTFYGISELTREIGEGEMPNPADSTLTDEEKELQMQMTMDSTSKVQALAESLVYEGVVEKREIPSRAVMEKADEQLNFTDEIPDHIKEEVDGDMPDFEGLAQQFYRIADH